MTDTLPTLDAGAHPAADLRPIRAFEWTCPPRPDGRPIVAATRDRRGGGVRPAPAGAMTPVMWGGQD